MFESFKPYKKEEYDKAEIEAEAARKIADIDGRTVPMPYPDSSGLLDGLEMYSPARKKEDRAYEVLKNLKNRAHSEALKLEEKHDKLMQKVKDAEEELEAFREKELGVDLDEGSER